MSSSSYSKKSLSILALQLLLLLQTCLLSFACYVEYDWDCEGRTRSVTHIITHYTNGDTEYNANVVFHWGTTDTNLGSRTYSDETNEEIESYQYEEDGEYYVGYTVTFEEGSGCEGKISERYYLLSFEDRGCGEVEYEGSVPTREPTLTNPSTPAPSTTPTTEQPTTPAPVITTATTSTPGTTTSAIDSAVSMTPETTPATTLTPIQEYEVLSTMILYNSEEMSTESKKVWRDVTEKTIFEEVVATTGIKPELVHVYVSIKESIRRILREISRGGKNVRMLRKLQAAAAPLKIVFITTLEFPSQEEDWVAEEMVAAGFDTQEKQQKYINSLKVRDSHFDSVKTISLTVNGDLVTDMSPAIDAVNKDKQKSGSDRTAGFIVAGAIGGAGILLLGIFVGKYYVSRNDRDETNAISVVTFDKNIESYEESNTNEPRGPYGASSANESLGPCLGVIEAKAGDDISALEDPTIFNVPYVEGDKTVGESTVSPLYGLGIPQPGSTVDDTSQSGGSTIDYSRMILEDDTLEDSFQLSPGNSAGDDSLQRYAVVAPSGKLGLIMDNPNGDFPVVCAIKEESVLKGKIEVGDLMLQVDEVDCFGLSAKLLSAILNVRSQNPARTLVLAKDSGITSQSASVSA